jgi:hypothetical protein
MLRFLRRLIAFPALAETEAGLWATRGGPVLFSFEIHRFDGKRHFQILGRQVVGPRSLLGIVVMVAVFVSMAATGQSEQNAAAIAAVAGVLLPLALKFIPAAGHYMVAISLGASIAIAVIAEVASGEMVLSNLGATNGQALLLMALSVWGLSQIVYASLTQSPKTAGAVT